jgi:hypothetical protein
LGKGLNVIMHLCGPEKPWFDETLKPSEIKDVK